MRPQSATAFAVEHYPAALIDVVELGGERVTIRPILPQDKDIAQAFVRDLSLGSRHRRFFSGVRELPAGLLGEFTEVDYRSRFALIAEIFIDDAEVMIGEARYVLEDDAADFAVAVADGWQGRGLGRLLLQRLECHAAAGGIARLTGDVLRDNGPMLTLAASAGFSVSPLRRGPSLVRIQKEIAAFAPCRERSARVAMAA